MSQKEKGKFHPFAGYLQAGEVLLWAYCDHPENLTLENGRARVARYTIPENEGCLPAIFQALGQTRPHRRAPLLHAVAYGVTNQRLLTRRNNVIIGKSLRKFMVPTKLIEQGDSATLNLGRTTWWWMGLPREEAEAALEIIEQAKRDAMPFYRY